MIDLGGENSKESLFGVSFSIWHINQAPLNESRDAMLSFSNCEKEKVGGLNYKSMDHEKQSGRHNTALSVTKLWLRVLILFPSPEMGCQPVQKIESTKVENI